MGCCIRSSNSKAQSDSDVKSMASEVREHYLIDQTMNVNFKLADILNQQVECVVLGTDLSLLNWTPVHITPDQQNAIDQSIERMYGPRQGRNFVIKEEQVVVLQFVNGLPQNQKIKWMILVGISRWKAEPSVDEDHLQKLKNIFDSVFSTLIQMRAASVCFTDISSLLFGVPVLIGAQALALSTKQYLEQIKGKRLLQSDLSVTSLLQILYVFQEEEALKIYSDALDEVLKDSAPTKQRSRLASDHYDVNLLSGIDNNNLHNYKTDTKISNSITKPTKLQIEIPDKREYRYQPYIINDIESGFASKVIDQYDGKATERPILIEGQAI